MSNVTPAPSGKVDIAASLAAHERVQQAISSLREQLRENAHAISSVEGAIYRLQHGHPPPAALKKAIVEHALACSEEVAKREILEGIRALGRQSGARAELSKPLTYKEALNNLPAKGAPHLSNVDKLTRVMFSEHALRYLCRDLIKENLTKLVDGLPPSFFGYDVVNEKSIGPDWAEREKQLSALSNRLSELKAQTTTIKGQLVQLGVPHDNIWGN